MRYPIGIRDFEKIRRDGSVYVDKTDSIYELATTGQYYFLSRPSRFGKSLLVSTMEAYFCGRKALFDGLAIASLEKDWIEHPVLRMDLSGKFFDSPIVLLQVLENFIMACEQKYGIDNCNNDIGFRFSRVIEAAYKQTGRRVVILIDECDKPVLDNIGNDDLAESFSIQLQSLYAVIKAHDPIIEFCFLTGFFDICNCPFISSLNLSDISSHARYAQICGFSASELEQYYGEDIKGLANNRNTSTSNCIQQLSNLYGGYHFHEGAPEMFCPYSILKIFHSGFPKEYDLQINEPLNSTIHCLLENGNYGINDISPIEVPPSSLRSFNPIFPSLLSLLYQTGILTIKGYDRDTFCYRLGFPNKIAEDFYLQRFSRIRPNCFDA